MKRSLSFLACSATVSAGMILTPASAAVKDGEAAYTAHCKNCHGADGSGNPAIAKMLNVTMKPLGSTDADIKAVVTAGTGKMKPVSGLADADLENLVAYIHTFKK